MESFGTQHRNRRRVQSSIPVGAAALGNRKTAGQQMTLMQADGAIGKRYLEATRPSNVARHGVHRALYVLLPSDNVVIQGKPLLAATAFCRKIMSKSTAWVVLRVPSKPIRSYARAGSGVMPRRVMALRGSSVVSAPVSRRRRTSSNVAPLATRKLTCAIGAGGS
jgi:hypothetical protein